MKMRKRKLYINSRIAFNNYWAFKRAVASARRLIDVFAAAVEAAKEEFVCIRVKDGVVVDTFDNVADARELVEKHYRGKKAKLFVENSLTGERVLFEEAAV